MWNLVKIYQNDEQWIQQIMQESKRIEIFPEIQFSSESINKNLYMIQEYSRCLDKLYTYGLLRREQEVSNRSIQFGLDEIKDLYSLFNKKIEPFLNVLIEEATSKNIFDKGVLNKEFIPLIKKLSKKKLIKNANLYNRISPYSTYLTWYQSIKKFGYFDFNNKRQNVSEDNILEILNSNRPHSRYMAYLCAEKSYCKNAEVAAFLLNSHLQIRNSEVANSNFACAYDYYISNMPFFSERKLNNLLISNQKGTIDLYKFLLTRKLKLLDLNKITYSDLYYTNDTEILDFSRAKFIIMNSFRGINKEFEIVLNEVFNNEWIFANVSDDKSLGQRSISCFEYHPFITVNWGGRLDDLLNLVHEITGAIAQNFASLNGMFFYSELSILKTEFMSFLGTLYVIDYLKVSNEFKEKVSISLLSDNFIIDALITPLIHSEVEFNLYKESSERRLDSELISDIWYTIVNKYHNFNFFKPMPQNRYNWVRADFLYLDGYNLNYPLAFLLAYKAFYFGINFDNLINLLKQGERLTDEEFFVQLFGENLKLNELLETVSRSIMEI